MNDINNLVNNLTVAEQNAAYAILNLFKDGEDILFFTASKISKEIGQTTSVATQTVSKLCISEIFLHRSLGMKGTMLKISDREQADKVKETLKDVICTNTWLRK